MQAGVGLGLGLGLGLGSQDGCGVGSWWPCWCQSPLRVPEKMVVVVGVVVGVVVMAVVGVDGVAVMSLAIMASWW